MPPEILKVYFKHPKSDSWCGGEISVVSAKDVYEAQKLLSDLPRGTVFQARVGWKLFALNRASNKYEVVLVYDDIANRALTHPRIPYVWDGRQWILPV